MRNFKLRSVCGVLLLAAIILSTFGAGTASARRRNFSFVNYSGRIVSYLYITQSAYRKWGHDLIGSTVLANGDSCGCWYDDRIRYFDVRVVFSDGSDAVFMRHSFRGLWRLTLFNRNGTYTIRSN